MMRINNVRVGKGSVLLTLNPDFYPPELVERTIEKFSDACSASVDEKDQKTLVTLRPKGSVPLKTLGYEFMNHLLADIKNEVGP
jgi:hypothetical protein